jgi:Crinkler effector protein N-terminal domain
MNTSPRGTRKRGKSPDISPALVRAPSTSSFGEAGGLTSRRLRCLVEGDSSPFTVTVALNAEIGDLKEIVHEKGINTAQSLILAKDLVLLKVHNPYAKTQRRC